MNKNFVILFDGQCCLCNNAINFIIRHDKKKCFRYSLLNSAFSKEKLKGNIVQSPNADSIVLIDNEQLYFKSRAIIKIFTELEFPFSLVRLLKIFPSKLLDYFYDMIAKNRYKWFGKTNKCLVPLAHIKRLFYE
ncbi:thiol-disulfide oxidoreductase DCC family protein [Melioribacteraceae bacterium 4301-Me]|uniref:thiol-disulfide oxidoreductase DCC family protein n=1 Tax=Pyranulibacter aquaticus TaxID=3163344 RepID=UPI00359A5645